MKILVNIRTDTVSAWRSAISWWSAWFSAVLDNAQLWFSGVPETLSFDSAGSRKRSALLSGILDSDSVQSRTASVWLTAVMDSSQLSSTLSWTVLKRCLGQLSTWLSAITDSFQLWINAVPKRAQLDSAWSRTALRLTQYCLAQFISANKV